MKSPKFVYDVYLQDSEQCLKDRCNLSFFKKQLVSLRLKFPWVPENTVNVLPMVAAGPVVWWFAELWVASWNMTALRRNPCVAFSFFWDKFPPIVSAFQA
jgi:hypothetical protein